MRRLAFTFLCSCVLVSLGFLAAPAQAGDYYGNGYYSGGYRSNVYYSSSCCYKKVVRHVTSTRYVRVDEGRPYYRSSYYDRPYRYGSYERPRYYDRPYRPARYVDSVNYDDYTYSPRPFYDGAYASAEDCSRRRIRVRDGYGGWVWGVKRNCY